MTTTAMDPQWSVEAILIAATVLTAAFVVHWVAQRAGRRVAVAIARRTRAGAAADGVAYWRRMLERVLLIPSLALWVGAGFIVSEQFLLLRRWRLLVVCLIQESFTAPLFKMGEMSYSALDLALLPVLLLALWFATGLATRVARFALFRSSAMQSGAQETLGVLTRVVVTFIGAVVVFQYWGIDLSSLAVLGGALGVGIGFGLQTIANNFVSGVVLGVERPIKPGDYVKVGELVGTVARIGARSTEIRTNDRVSILVPNSRLLEHEVVNWSHGDPTSRIHIPVQVANGSDLRRVRVALLAAARSHPEVLADPRPDVELRGFGENGLDVELLVWTRDPRAQLKLTSDLCFRVERALRASRIELPSPQRDVHVHAPELEKAVTAWRRHAFPESEHAANGHPATEATHSSTRSSDVGAEPCGALADASDDIVPQAWDDGRLAAMAASLRGPGGVAVLDRRHFLRLYPRCFVGREAVDWLTQHEHLTRDEALVVGRRLMERGLVRHVLDEHDFKDEVLFYRFHADEDLASRPAVAGI